jgi:YHS domain-containing protein
MKNRIKISMALAIVGFLSTGYAFAHEGHDHEAVQAKQNTAVSKSKAVEVGNKLCPVTGNPVNDGKMGETVKYEYKGRVYNLCCQMCVKDFKKNPKKYMKVAEDEVKGSKK